MAQGNHVNLSCSGSVDAVNDCLHFAYDLVTTSLLAFALSGYAEWLPAPGKAW